MFEVVFYEDRHGKQPVKEFLIELQDKARTSKDARIQYQKVLTLIRALEVFGTRIGAPQVKHMDGNLWELRPLAHRISFFYWQQNKFVLLHHFVKKSQNTQPKEIERAAQNMKDFVERKN